MVKIQAVAGALLAAACATPGAELDPDGSHRTIAVQSLTSDEFSDLRPLLPALEDVRIVQLGENSHGAGEYFDLKARLVRFLHQEAGFDVLIFESSLYQCARVDAAMAGTDADTETLLTGCAFGVWHTGEVLSLFEYMHASRSGPAPLRLAGYDVQPIGWNKRGRPGFLSDIVARLDADYAEAVAALDQEVIDVYGEGGSARRAHYRAHRERLVTAYADLEDWLASNAAPLEQAGADPGDILIARQTAWSVLQYLRQQTAPDLTAYAEARDYGMAANARALVEEMFPDSRVIIWAHNAHVRHNNERLAPGEAEFIQARGAGSWLRDWYGEELLRWAFMRAAAK